MGGHLEAPMKKPAVGSKDYPGRFQKKLGSSGGQPLPPVTTAAEVTTNETRKTPRNHGNPSRWD